MTTIAIPGGRDVRASLDDPVTGGSDSGARAGACVVACPPHPEYGGSRSDSRLRAVAGALGERGVACLRFDYGPWDEGRGERGDAGSALDWVAERYDRLGLFGYSFGGGVALTVAAERDDVGALAVLAPAATLPDGTDAAAAVGGLTAPVLVVSGERDDTVDWERVVAAAREAGHAVESVPADHHFVGQAGRVGDRVGSFLAAALA